MWWLRGVVIVASVAQIALGAVVHSVALMPEGGRVGLGVAVLAGGSALLALVAAPLRFVAVAANGVLLVGCLPPLAAGVLDGFVPPPSSPLGGWLYPVVGGFAAGCAANAVGISRLAARNQQRHAEPGAAADGGA